MVSAIKKLPLPWRGIQIKITHQAQYNSAELDKIMGYQLAHITVKANQPLPFTETGYRSIFLPEKAIQEAGGAVALVKTWLDEKAKSKAWQMHVKEKSQLTLF